MDYSEVYDDSFETKIALRSSKTQNHSISEELFHSKEGHIFPIYNHNYKYLQQQILSKAQGFNNALRSLYPFTYTKSSALLDLNDPTMTFYNSCFPEKQYLVNKDEYFIKPACCAAHHKIWAQKGHLVRKKEILHEVSDCYRVQNSGTTRNLIRGNYFTMPDYHFTTTLEEETNDFLSIRSAMFNYYSELFGCNWRKYFVEVVRVVASRKAKYADLIERCSKGSTKEEFYVQELDDRSTHYFHFKYQLMYRNFQKPFTVGTIQLDHVYPDKFRIDRTHYGLKPTLHFSPGGIGRQMAVLIDLKAYLYHGFKIYLMGQNINQKKKIVEQTLQNYNLQWDLRSSNLSEALRVKSEDFLFEIMIVVGDEDFNKNECTIVYRSMDPSKRRQQKLLIRELPQLFEAKVYKTGGNRSLYIHR